MISNSLVWRNLTTPQTELAFEEFNLSFCTLTSLLLKASEPSPSASSRSTRTRRQPKRKSSSFLPVQTTRVTEYIARRLSGASAVSGIAVPITPIAYVALLPSIWTFISNPMTVDENGDDGDRLERSDDLLNAVLDHAVKIPSKSPCKRATVEFVGKLFLVGRILFYFYPCGTNLTQVLSIARHLAAVSWF
jgi:pre-rRNA-processing protein IPI1